MSKNGRCHLWMAPFLYYEKIYNLMYLGCYSGISWIFHNIHCIKVGNLNLINDFI